MTTKVRLIGAPIEGSPGRLGDNVVMSIPPDDQRPVDLFDDEPPVLPDQTADDTDVGWGGGFGSSDDDDARLLEDRPPHW